MINTKKHKEALLILILLSIFGCSEDKEFQQPPTPKYDLPQVYITTPNEEKIASKENWVKDGNIIIEDRYGNICLDIESDFRGRGNSTWQMPKKSYAIKLEKKSRVLSMPKHKRWILLANWLDRTLLRNDVALEIARTCLPFTPKGEFVELYINNEFRGNYYLCEQIKIDENRVNIDEINATTTEENMTGGYLLEFDTNSKTEINSFYTKHKNYPVTIKEPDEKIITSWEHAAFKYITNYINNVEDVLISCKYEEIEKLLDVKSYADWWLVYNLVGNIEPGHPKSCYMYKKRNGKLYAGPAWDFDWGTFMPGRKGGILKSVLWYEYLFKHKQFKEIIKKRWKELYPKFEQIIPYIDEKAKYIELSNERNIEMWPINLNVNLDVDLSFKDAVERLKSAYIERMNELNIEIKSY